MQYKQVVGHDTEAGIMLRGASRERHSEELLQCISALVMLRAAAAPTNYRWPTTSELPIISGIDAEKLWDWGVVRGWWDPVTGARVYVDHHHPEWSTAEELTPRRAVLRAMQGQRRLEAAAVELAFDQDRNPAGRRIMLFGNNTDGDPRVSFGGHVSISFGAEVSRRRFTGPLGSFLAVLQVLTGAGAIVWDKSRQRYRFSISQRAPYIENDVGPQTTFNRSVVNTRDTSLDVDESRRRMHIICLDTNMNEVACLLKDGLLMIVMGMIEDDAWPRELELVHILRDFRGVAADPTLKYQLELAHDQWITAVALLRKWQRSIEDYFDRRSVQPWQFEILERFDQVLSLLESNKFEARSTIEWIFKLEAMLGLKQRLGLADGVWRHPKLQAIDLQYHSYIHTQQVEGDRVGLYHQAKANGRVDSLLRDADLDRESWAAGRAAIRQLLGRRYGTWPFDSWRTLTLFDPADPTCWRRGAPWIRFQFGQAVVPVPEWLSDAVAASPQLTDLHAALRRLFGFDGGIRDNLEVRFRPDGFAATGVDQDEAYD